MRRDFPILFSKEQIDNKIAEMASKLDSQFQSDSVVGIFVLKGAMIFGTDLVRAMKKNIIMETLGVYSYSGTLSTGAINIYADVRTDLANKEVLLIEDIVDTGLTLKNIKEFILQKGPSRLITVSLLNKKAARKCEIEPDLTGFEIDDHFVIGYGFDLDQNYRNLPNICIYST